MPPESEDELQASAMKYLRRHSMKYEEWRFTRLGQLHPELELHVKLAQGERPIVSSLVESGNWYVFTTRRVIAGVGGSTQSFEAIDVEDEDFGNFKGFVGSSGPGALPTTMGTVRNRLTGKKLRIEFETLYASMAPIYACKFFMRRSKRLLAELRNPPARTDA